jgi:signal transduction histidine kinase
MIKHNSKHPLLIFLMLSFAAAECIAINTDYKLRQDSILLNQYILPGIKKADSLMNSGYYSEAISTAQNLIDSIGNNANYIENCERAYFIIAHSNKELRQNGTALKNYMRTLQYLKILNNEDLIGRVYIDLGELYNDWGLLMKSIEYYQYALDYSSSGIEQASLIEKIISLYSTLEDYDNSCLYLSRLLKIYSQSDNNKNKLTVMQRLTDNYIKTGKLDKAIFLQTQVLQIQESVHDEMGRLFTINKMAHIYLQMDNYDFAMRYFRAYYDLTRDKKPEKMEPEERLLFADTKITFGKYLEKYGDLGEPDNYTHALEYYQTGLDLYLAMKNKEKASGVYYLIAGINYKTGDHKSSIINVENSLLLTDNTTRDYEKLMNSYKLLSMSYEGLEKYKQAIYASKQYNSFKDSVNNQRFTQQLNLLKRQSDYNNNESFIHRIEQMIAEEEMNNLAITRLELQADKNKQEIELLAKEKTLQNYSLKNEQLKKEKVIQDLQLVNQKYETEKKDREIDILHKNREIQALALKQQILEQQEKEKAISLLEKEKKLSLLELQKADAQRYILIIAVVLSILVLALVIRSYIQARKAKEKIALKNAEIEENNLKLKDLNQEKNRLIRIVAHDLRNPLTSAITLTGILKSIEKDLPEEYSHSIQLLRKSLLRMQDMIVKILDIKSIDQEKINLEIEAVNPGKIIGHVIDLFREKAKNKNITIHSEFLELYILADRNFLIQIFENLLSNAIKFSKPGSHVYLKVSDYADKCRIMVKDEGPGFSEHDQALMFTEYQKLSAKPTGGEKSNGLGLSIVKKYIDAMNGRIWCESIKGQGATFTLEFFKAFQEA